jgi:glutamine synthetase
MFEKDGIFPPGVIDAQAAKLRAYNDKDLLDKISGDKKKFSELVEKYIHIG